MNSKSLFCYLFKAILFVLFLQAPAKAQLLEKSPNFHHLTVDEGLSHNTVYAIAQDHDGFIWIGTRNGLNKYDGFGFKVYFSGIANNEIASPTVFSLFVDNEHNVWVGHKEAGITVINNKTGLFKKFVGNDSKIDWASLTVRKIYQDKTGNIWLGTSGDGLICVNRNGDVLKHFTPLAKDNRNKIATDFVFDIVEDKKGDIWFANSGDGFYQYEKSSNKINYFVDPNDASKMNSYEKSLLIDKHDNIWIGTSGNGLYKYQATENTFTHYSTYSTSHWISNNRISAIDIDSKGKLWIGTDGGGLNYFDEQQNNFVNIISSNKNPQSLNTNAVYSLFFDKSGTLWVGTFNGGLNVQMGELSPFVLNSISYPLNNIPSVLSIYQDKKKNIFLGTDGDGLLFVKAKDIRKNTIEISQKKFPHRVITCLKEADKESIWVGTFASGLSLYQPTTGKTITYQANEYDNKALSHNNVWDIEVAPDGNLWIATLGGGMCYFNRKENVFNNYKPIKGNNNSISSFQIIDVLLDQNKKYVWAASEDKGLNRFDIAAGVFKHYQTDKKNKGLSSNKIRCLFQDKKGKIWIGTEYNGINILDPTSDKIKILTTENGLNSNEIYSIEQDKFGVLWVSTQKGVQSVDPETYSCIDFGTDDNLRHNQYNPKASFLINSNELYFGGTNGFSIINPIKKQIEPGNQKIIFSALKLFNQDVSIGNYNDRVILEKGLNEKGTIINLDYLDRAISIEFTTNDYSKLKNTRFAYQLVGFEKNWNVLSIGVHSVFFSNLLPGNYKLKVKLVNMNNTSSEEFTLPIYVKPPFWETWWFVMICILMSVLGIIFTVVYILNRQKAQYQYQSNLAKQEILRLRNENLENEIKVTQSEQEILQLQNDSLKQNIVYEKQEQEILRLKNNNLEREIITKKTEEEILRLTNDNLAKELEAKQTRLAVSLLQSAHKNQFLNDLKSMLQKIDPKTDTTSSDVKKVIRQINTEVSQEDYWEQYQFNFDEMHKDFVQKIKELHPSITVNDHRLCSFILLGLNNREIADILHITINGVEQNKYRLKKKLLIDDKSTLNEYIKTIQLG